MSLLKFKLQSNRGATLTYLGNNSQINYMKRDYILDSVKAYFFQKTAHLMKV